jgi:hypothetical protein
LLAAAWLAPQLALAVDYSAGRPELLEAAESAQATAVGTVAEPTRLDHSGFRATLHVERILAGDLGGAESVSLGWEEKGVEPRSRFREGERILVALERVPGNTLWLQRFPGRRGFAIAARFGAFLRSPDPRSLDLLERYLALDPSSRRREPGVTALCRLVAAGHPVLAEAAVKRLSGIPGLAGRLAPAAAEALTHALGDATRPVELRERVVELAGSRRLQSLRAAVEMLATPGAQLEAPALAALAGLDGGIPPQRVAALLNREEPPVRLVAVVYGSDAISDAQLAALIRRDRAPDLRAASVAALLRRRGLAGLDAARPALFDPEGRVRGEAALQVAALGSEAVPALRSMIGNQPAQDLTGVFTALRWIGAEGIAVLEELASSHPDEKVRGLAILSLGRVPPH